MSTNAVAVSPVATYAAHGEAERGRRWQAAPNSCVSLVVWRRCWRAAEPSGALQVPLLSMCSILMPLQFFMPASFSVESRPRDARRPRRPRRRPRYSCSNSPASCLGGPAADGSLQRRSSRCPVPHVSRLGVVCPRWRPRSHRWPTQEAADGARHAAHDEGGLVAVGVGAAAPPRAAGPRCPSRPRWPGSPTAR